MDFDFRYWKKALSAIRPSNHYIESYPELLKASKCLTEKFGAESIPMIAHLVYGWMPRGLIYSREKLQDDKIFHAVNVKTESEAINVINSIDYPPTNNAWVGMSKTLHFLNPEFFPIWDSKIAKKVLRKKNVGHIMKKKDVYRCYMKFIFSKTKCPFVDKIIDQFQNNAGYRISRVRAVEFVLFVVDID